MLKTLKKLMKVFMLPIGIVLLILSVFLFRTGFTWLSEVRQIDRLPITPVSALASGPYAVSGSISREMPLLKAPYSGQGVVYYRYQLEEEYRDSEGRRQTRTIDSGSSSSVFAIQDGTGRVLVDPTLGGDIDWDIKQTYNQKRGNRIYSEWSLAPRSKARMIGQYTPDRKALTFYDMQYNLPAIVTTYTIKSNGGERLLYSGLMIALATGTLAIGFAFCLSGAGIHRFWIYVSVMISGTVILLWTLGFTLLKKDWELAGELYQHRLNAVSSQSATTLQEQDLYQMFLLIRRGAQAWPDRPLFDALAFRYFPQPMQLSAQQKQETEQTVSAIPYSQFDYPWITFALAFVGIGGGVFVARFGLKIIIFKRKIEAIPTSKTQGLTYGLAELFGIIEVDDACPATYSMLKNQKCVAYEFKIQEKRGSGKRAKWVTIEEGGEWPAFWLEDDEGRVKVYGSDADIRFPEQDTWYDGRLKYTERWLPPFHNIYCLGYAAVDPETSDRLAIMAREDELTLITTQEESDLVRSEGSKGLLITGVSLGMIMMGFTSILAGIGQLTPVDLLQVSLVAPLFLFIITIIIHYNDLVFLRNRVKKVAADIETLLQRRFDLWGSLADTVKGYLSHEKKLQEAVTLIRTAGSTFKSPDHLDSRVRYEQKVTKAILMRAEAHPDLKGSELIRLFQQQMERTENQLALVRNGLADSIEIYNTRIEQLPDKLLAAPFKFKPEAQFAWVAENKEANIGSV